MYLSDVAVSKQLSQKCPPLSYDENSQYDQPMMFRQSSNDDDEYNPDDDSDESDDSSVEYIQDKVPNCNSNDEGSNMSFTFPVLPIKPASSIQILTAIKTTKGGWTSKEHACYFCYKLYVNIARHIKHVHADEIRVAKILSMRPKMSYKFS